MKHLFLLSFVLLSFQLTSQSIPTTVKAMGEGDVASLAQLLDDEIEICINDVPDLYNKKEARAKLKSFFSKNKPISFARKHGGDSKGKDSQYIIGDLKTSDKDFRVYIYFSNVNGKKKIQEFRFDSN